MEYVASKVEAVISQHRFDVDLGFAFAGFIEFVECCICAVDVRGVVFVVVECHYFLRDDWFERVVLVG